MMLTLEYESPNPSPLSPLDTCAGHSPLSLLVHCWGPGSLSPVGDCAPHPRNPPSMFPGQTSTGLRRAGAHLGRSSLQALLPLLSRPLLWAPGTGQSWGWASFGVWVFQASRKPLLPQTS